ncbi:MAG: hypothetical protein LN413_00535 [Candidatus Thermoplasmatota archaeon]|nr:hypothetical protein [Candidatus Thermoplasmatota archaeon]
MSEQEMEDWGEPISVYTSAQATEDGVLVSVAAMNKDWVQGPFSHITANLMAHGYYEEDGSPRLVNVMDLLNQALKIVRKDALIPGADSIVLTDWYYSGKIEFPDGQSGTVTIAQNETEKYTIMLPEDY